MAYLSTSRLSVKFSEAVDISTITSDCIRTHIQMHTHAHTNTYIQMHTHTHTNTRTHKHYTGVETMAKWSTHELTGRGGVVSVVEGEGEGVLRREVGPLHIRQQVYSCLSKQFRLLLLILLFLILGQQLQERYCREGRGGGGR